MTKRMTVVFDDEELYTSVKVEAARRHVPAKDLVAEALRDWLELQEDREDLEALREGREDYEREGGIDLEDVLEERGLEA
jgi:hypothetical protein